MVRLVGGELEWACVDGVMVENGPEIVDGWGGGAR